MTGPDNLGEYFASLPGGARATMEQIRRAIKAAAPDATEAFSYRMPAFKLHGRSLIWYAAFRDHYSLYPATDVLRRELGGDVEPHLSGKGTIRFDADKPIPMPLIEKIVRVRVAELEQAHRR